MTTLKNVAEIAEVSVASVSRYFNAPEKVRPETRKRIQAAIKVTGYRFNYSAKVLSTQRTHTIGLVIPTITNTVFAESTRGLQDVAALYDYQVLMTNADYEPVVETKLIRHLLERQVDALVVTVSNPEKIISAELADVSIPLVTMFSSYSHPSVLSVGIDNEQGGYDATEHLVKLGHKRIAMLAGSFLSSDRSRDRYEGYLKCLRHHGLKVDPRMVIEVPFSLEYCKFGVRELLKAPEPPTAIFASNDLMAIGVMNVLQELGYDVPGDISVIGFDDIPMASFISPKLTTIRQPVYEMGRMAGRQLFQALEQKENVENQSVLKHELIVRESTAQCCRI